MNADQIIVTTELGMRVPVSQFFLAQPGMLLKLADHHVNRCRL